MTGNADCTCPQVKAGSYVSSSRAWEASCPVHGVGTVYFRSLGTPPFGYRDCQDMTRDEYLGWLTDPDDEQEADDDEG
jgi:hypothetical protein